jgi:hypothetical protein
LRRWLNARRCRWDGMVADGNPSKWIDVPAD